MYYLEGFSGTFDILSFASLLDARTVLELPGGPIIIILSLIIFPYTFLFMHKYSNSIMVQLKIKVT